MVINSGPAEAKSFIVHLSLGHPKQYPHTLPPVVYCPPIVESGVDYAGGGQTYQISVSKLPPNSSCQIIVTFSASEALKEQTIELWNSNSFSTDFYGRFFKSITITGENITQTFESVAFQESQSTWDLP